MAAVCLTTGKGVHNTNDVLVQIESKMKLEAADSWLDFYSKSIL